MMTNLAEEKTARGKVRLRSAIRSHWPRWVGYGAALWSLIYGALGLYWALGGNGFPFGRENDRGASESLLVNAQAETTAPVIAALGAIGLVVALVMARTRIDGIPRVLLLAFAWIVAIALLVVIPDRRVLVAVAYAPLFLVGAPFHWPPVSFLVAIPWPVINQLILIVGGALWAGTALAYQRRSVGACEHCGRLENDSAQWTSPLAAARWGKWAVGVSIVVPAIYAATRYAWALGIPLGISEAFLREGQETGAWLGGAGLGTVALGGALLTLGLVQRWGEVFPRWMVGLAGRRVPPALAIVPALFVAIIVTSGGLEDLRIAVTGASMGPIELTWSTLGPTLLWPVWGVALAAATYAYYLRRRGRCGYCGRG